MKCGQLLHYTQENILQQETIHKRVVPPAIAQLHCLLRGYFINIALMYIYNNKKKKNTFLAVFMLFSKFFYFSSLNWAIKFE